MAQCVESALLAVIAVEGMLEVVEVLEIAEVGMLAEVEVTSVAGMPEVVVCTCDHHVQLTAWVDRVADTGLAEERMAGRHDPSKIRN